MFRIQQITDNAYQQQTLVLPDGESIFIQIEYKPMQYGWFIRRLEYLDFVINGVRICTSPNLLYAFKNQIPFGLACTTEANNEPTQQQDFSSGRSKLYILTAEEVEALQEFYENEV